VLSVQPKTKKQSGKLQRKKKTSAPTFGPSRLRSVHNTKWSTHFQQQKWLSLQGPILEELSKERQKGSINLLQTINNQTKLQTSLPLSNYAKPPVTKTTNLRFPSSPELEIIPCTCKEPYPLTMKRTSCAQPRRHKPT